MRDFGCYKDLSNEDYHADKEFISRSSIMDFHKSAYNYWAKHLNPDRPKKDATPAMELGSAFHTLMLEKHLFNDKYLVKPDAVLLKEVGREKYDSYKKICEEIENSNKTILTRETYLTLEAMEKKLSSVTDAIELIMDARIENSFLWQDEESGLFLKSRPDILHHTIIGDLKTCADASEKSIQNELFKYGYDIQMAMIRDSVEKIEGRRIENFILICIETKYPHNVGIHILDEEIINNAERKYKDILSNIKECIEQNRWNDYGVNRILLPKWAVYE